jgi:hypothetical protein
MNYQEYIKSELLILIPVLYFVGQGIKKSKLPDKWIPVLLGITGVTLAAVWVLATGEISNCKELAAALFTAVTQGVLVAGASVYVKQLCIQANKHDEEQKIMFEEITDFPQQNTFNEEDMTVREDDYDGICNANDETLRRE